MATYFTSDPHWGHRFVASLRGFHGDTSAHDLALLENFQRTVKRGDIVWWLGDLAMGNPEYALQMTAAIDGEHHLITGNHDMCNPMHRDAHRWQPKYLEVFKSVQPFARRRIPKRVGYVEAMLSHYPYVGGDPAEMDHSAEPRHTQYRLPDEGRWLLHGHTHRASQRLHSGHQIHVGLDAWGMQPVSLDTISSIIQTSLSNPESS